MLLPILGGINSLIGIGISADNRGPKQQASDNIRSINAFFTPCSSKRLASSIFDCKELQLSSLSDILVSSCTCGVAHPAIENAIMDIIQSNVFLNVGCRGFTEQTVIIEHSYLFIT